MPIQFGNGFKITSREPIDTRLTLSNTEMRNAGITFLIPDHYFAVNTDDGALYVYDTNNTLDPVTGKFRKVETDLVAEEPLNKVGNTISIELTDEVTEDSGLPITSGAVNEIITALDTVKQNVITEGHAIKLTDSSSDPTHTTEVGVEMAQSLESEDDANLPIAAGVIKAALDEKVNTTDFENLNITVGEHDIAIGALETETSELNSGIEDLSERVGTNETSISTLNESLGGMNTRIRTAETNIGKNTDDISALSGRTASVEGDITRIDGELDDKQDDLTGQSLGSINGAPFVYRQGVQVSAQLPYDELLFYVTDTLGSGREVRYKQNLTLATGITTIDDVPTDGSTRPVQSGGVYDAIQDIPVVSANPATTTETLTGLQIGSVAYEIQGGGTDVTAITDDTATGNFLTGLTIGATTYQIVSEAKMNAAIQQAIGIALTGAY